MPPNMHSWLVNTVCTAEQSLSKSVVDPEGYQLGVSKIHLGRHHKPLFKVQHSIVPCNRKARDGDIQPLCDQSSVHLRSIRTQAHRLQSLVRQLHALQKNYKEVAFHQACHLWTRICNAPGYHASFLVWVEKELNLTLSFQLPALNVVGKVSDLVQR